MCIPRSLDVGIEHSARLDLRTFVVLSITRFAESPQNVARARNNSPLTSPSDATVATAIVTNILSTESSSDDELARWSLKMIRIKNGYSNDLSKLSSPSQMRQSSSSWIIDWSCRRIITNRLYNYIYSDPPPRLRSFSVYVCVCRICFNGSLTMLICCLSWQFLILCMLFTFASCHFQILQLTPCGRLCIHQALFFSVWFERENRNEWGCDIILLLTLFVLPINNLLHYRLFSFRIRGYSAIEIYLLTRLPKSWTTHIDSSMK